MRTAAQLSRRAGHHLPPGVRRKPPRRKPPRRKPQPQPEREPGPNPRRKPPTSHEPVHSGTGERHGKARLTWPKVRAIRAEYAAGKTQQQLAETYGVGKSTIRDVVRGFTWQEDQ